MNNRIIFPVKKNGERIIFKKYSDYFLMAIQTKHPLPQGANRIELTWAEFVDVSKTSLLSSVVKSANQRLDLRNNLLSLPWVNRTESGRVIIDLKGTTYCHAEEWYEDTFKSLDEYGADAMHLPAMIAIIDELCSDNRIVAQKIYNMVISRGTTPMNTVAREKCNKLIKIFKENFQYFFEDTVEDNGIESESSEGLKWIARPDGRIEYSFTPSVSRELTAYEKLMQMSLKERNTIAQIVNLFNITDVNILELIKDWDKLNNEESTLLN